MTASDLALHIAGHPYAGWTDVEVTLSLEQLAATFKLGVTADWGQADAPTPILPGQECTVHLGGEPVLVGHVDAVFPSYDAQSHTVAVWGRDAVADLVDCSAIHKTGQWAQKNLAAIARDLCNPFGIQVIDPKGTGDPFPSVTIQEGESVFELLERLAKQRGLLLWSDGTGALMIGRRTPVVLATFLERGVNLEAAQGEFSQRDRCSLYVVKGQMPGDDLFHGPAASRPTAETPDLGVGRYRPLVVLSEAAGGIAAYQQRAAWERDVRKARGTRVTYTVAGWSHAEGLWDINTLVRVTDDWLSLDRQMLIAGVTYRFDGNGRRTELTVVEPTALDMVPIPAKPKKKKDGNLWAP